MIRPARLRFCLIWLLAIAVGGVGCDFRRSSTTPNGPSPTPGSGFSGRWTSSAQQSAIPPPGSCANFVWDIDQSNPANVTAQFTATCGNGFVLDGSGTGALDSTGTVLTWDASGIATGPDSVTCEFLLSDTAVQTGNDVVLDYFGSTCVGPVSGNELLQRVS